MMTIKFNSRARARRFGLAFTGVALAASGVVGSMTASAASTASVANDTLVVDTGSGVDRVALRLAAGAPGTLEVDLGDDGSADHSFDRATFSRIEVSLGSGNDEFRVDQVNGAFADEALVVDGDSGRDIMNGGDNIELFIGGSGDDFADGNRGNDTGVMGSGSDVFRWDPGDGSDVVEGDSGNDTLDFNGAGVNEVMSLSPNGGRSLFLREPAAIRMDMDNVERLDLTALGGVDTMRFDDMSGTDFKQADVDLSGPAGGPDGQSDVVSVNGTERADRINVSTDGARVAVDGLKASIDLAGSEPADQLQINTLGGDDTVDVADGVEALISVAVS
jgi:hypothetical protein